MGGAMKKCPLLSRAHELKPGFTVINSVLRGANFGAPSLPGGAKLAWRDTRA
jgi:hypothetical protein